VEAGWDNSLATLRSRDCDLNGINDDLEIAAGAPDCNSDGWLDSCEISAGYTPDCNFNNIPDACDIATGSPDCNINDVPDSCDISSSTSLDADLNNIPDECSLDCNNNGLLDTAELAFGLTPDCNANAVPDDCDIAAGTPDCDASGVIDSCELIAGAPDCDGDQLIDACEVDANTDGIPDDCQDGGLPYCFGSGPTTGGVACPCGNIGATGNGCPNSQNPAGARLEAIGLPSRVADSLVLRGTGMPPVATVLYFQGTGQTNGVLLGDGLRCAVGITVRLGYATNVGGASQWPPTSGVPIHTGGQVPAAGAVTRYYQGWYRDVSPSFCTTNRYNLTNGVAVVWVP